MEMPFDVLNHRLGKIRDNGDIDFDNTAAALDIDMELQAKYLFFPIEELEAAEIREVHSGTFHIGDGPEKCSAQGGENPAWLYNHALNALALYWHLKRREELEEEQRKIEAVWAKRPEPGLYQGRAAQCFTVIVTEDRRVLVQMDQGGLRDATEDWDTGSNQIWRLQRIDITDGTIQP